MAFVASQAVVLGAGAVVAIPAVAEVGGNGITIPLFSHIRLPGGTTYTFDNGVVWVVPATTDSVLAIPAGARFITATAASTAQLGKMD